MAIIDKQKEKVANYRLMWFVSITTLLAMIAFIFNSFEKLNLLKQLLIAAAGITLTLITLYFSSKLKEETEKLEDL